MAGLIVHEWISQHGGSENVAEAMARTFPSADLLCLWNEAPERFDGRPVRESWLAKTPLRRHKAAALPFMPALWSRTDVSDADFLLVSSHLFAHHVGGTKRDPQQPKFVYVHTPARYVWAPELDGRGNGLAGQFASPFLRHLDRSRAGHGAVYAANSEFVRQRINESWGQDATVIYPPVDVDRIQDRESWGRELTAEELRILDSLPEVFVLGASRFVPYKRLDVVIAAGEAASLPVVLVGAGPQRADLAAAGAAAAVPVTIIDRPSNAMLYALYERASVFVFPAIEDFGIMPVEAMALGTPVVVYSEGGARESVEALRGGEVVESFSPSALATAIANALSVDMTDVPSDALRGFGQKAFSDRLLDWTGIHAVR